MLIPFLAFSDLTCQLGYTGKGVFLSSDTKETEFGNNHTEASPSAGKNTGVVLVPCLLMEACPYSYFQWCGYLWSPSETWSLWLMAILSKACKPHSFEFHNSLKLSFTNIQSLCSILVDCKSFHESNSPDILPLCQRNLDDSIDSGNFSMRG